MGKIVYLILIIAAFISHEADGKSDVFVKQFDVKEIKKGYGYVTLSFKVDVYNEGSGGTIFITLQGLDREGFEVVSHTFLAKFDDFEAKTITDTSTYSIKEYEKIWEWKLKSVTK